MNWRTDTVRALCRAMRETRDYSACPILADALQDADYPDANVLCLLREPQAPWFREKLVALLYSDETAAAVRWLEQFVRDINYSANDGYEKDAATGKTDYDRPVNERQSDTDPHDYEFVVDQGRLAAGHRAPGKWDGPGAMHFATDAGVDYFRGNKGNAREFFKNWSLATGLPAPADLSAVRYMCAC